MMDGTVTASELLIAIVGVAEEIVMEGVSRPSASSESESSLSDSLLAPKVILGIVGRVEDDDSSSVDSLSSFLPNW